MLILEKNVILASKSPRRQELLKGLDIAFQVKSKDTDESYPPELPHEKVAEYLARKKAEAFRSSLKEEDLIITSDTVVITDHKILEKPATKEDAHQMLRNLSGRIHKVITGVCMMDSHKTISFDDVTQVHFAEINDAEIQYYIERYKPFDKAGAYGIQEWIGYVGVDKIIGSFYTVMGLPVHKVYKELKNWDSN
ncbi:septum formation protein Maf [Litoribacter ruber]|uniref:dTTP/UTP pyrophosphatase n=1 Tax=Litoribacter ruber TaxID=702568 RepID=A0AAP2G364_9BACT|nr:MULTISPECIES: Maf family nucleotide pyrophosphatase [Litoribacter]MBS9523130.1 septum formation protein Maf [Litoribacter alkaliphilus]MBT0810707.1 septum formation protein Maf [Litoribacter ruber]